MPHPETSQSQPFQVELRGIIDLLSRHIYSGPRVYLRELLQNGRDAVVARGQADGVLRIRPATANHPYLSFTDNGIGLTRDEAESLLATVGRSSKRDDMLALRREDYLGQFGIGLLSCFMVSDEIEVRSRSASGAAPVLWRASSDGTFIIRELSGDEAAIPVGTEVRLRPRPDDAALLGPARVRELATTFGAALPIPVEVADDAGSWHRVTSDPAFLAPVNPVSGPTPAQLDLGREIVGAPPLDAIEIVVPGTDTRGIAFVLPYAPAPGRAQTNRTYLGRMLLSEQERTLLPDWAFFVRCVFNTDGLTPTASREALVENDALEYTREAIGQALRNWLLLQAATRPDRLAQIVAVHQLGFKAMAVHDDELANVVVSLLTIETSAGSMTIEEYLGRFDEIRYAETIDEFRQLAALSSAEAPVINGGYAFDAQLLRHIGALREIPARRITVAGELDALAVPDLVDRAATTALESRAEAALSALGIRVAVRTFAPADIPALYVADAGALRRMDRSRAADLAPGLWANVLKTTDRLLVGQTEVTPEEAPAARLALNWAHPLVRSLVRLDDDLVLARSVELLYVQALLAGHHPLTPNDRALLSGALGDLIQLSITVEDTP